MKTKTTPLSKIITQTRDNAWARFVVLYPQLAQFKKPKILFNNRIYRTAGRCFVEYNTIEISSKLYRVLDNRDEIINTIIPHEIAHQVDYNLYGEPNRWHGKTWQDIMVSFGLPANPYHSLEI